MTKHQVYPFTKAFNSTPDLLVWIGPQPLFVPSFPASIQSPFESSLNLRSFTQADVAPFVTTQQRVPMLALLNLAQQGGEVINCDLNQAPTDHCQINMESTTFQELVTINGFLFEQHQVTTPDGYILTVFRIRDPSKAKQGAPVVFMQHGILSSAWTFVSSWSELAPAFNFARQGYDVWVGNNRGNMYSRQNLYSSPETDPASFFAYSFQQMGLYDFPAQVDMVRSQTGAEKVTYVGHSQGTTEMFYMLCAHQPEVAARVNLFVAMNPVAYMNHLDVPFLKHLADLTSGIKDALSIAGFYEFLGPAWDEYSAKVCGHWFSKELCRGLEAFKDSELGSKYNYGQRLKLSSTDKPNGISLQQLVHFGQVIEAGQMVDYNFGSAEENMKQYGQAHPAKYEFSSITDVPVAMVVGLEDPIGDPKDAEQAASEIQSMVFYKEYPNCDHLSFNYGKYNDWMADILPVVEQYNPLRF